MRHLDDPTLVAYVDGTLAGDDVEQLEAHVVGCSACAARLQRAAWLETAMFEAAAAMHPPRVRTTWSRRIARLAQMPAGFGLAASLVLGLGMPARWLDLDVDVRIARADVGDGHGSTPWDEAPECEAPADSGGETCDDPTVGDDLLAMSWPPDEEPGANLCGGDDSGELWCPGGEPRGG